MKKKKKEVKKLSRTFENKSKKRRKSSRTKCKI